MMFQLTKATQEIERWVFSLGLVASAVGGIGDVQAQSAPTMGIYRGTSFVERSDTSRPLSELAAIAGPSVQTNSIRGDDRPSGLERAPGPQSTDPVVQNWAGTARDIPSTLQSFDGISSTGVYPPDPNGEVGTNHFVQTVNSQVAVYNKTGGVVMGPVNINTLFAGFGGACQTENAGDPVVLYDQFADRWFVAQFTAAGPTYFLCIAISTSPDPAGTYYRYAVSTGTNFPDYPKFSVWSDTYFAATREFAGSSFAGVGAYAMNRAQMLAGNPSPTIISFVAPPTTPYTMGDSLLPADIDGTTLPPNGSPGYFIGSQDDGGPYGAPSDAINIWKFNVDYVTPANSTFALSNTIASAAFDSMLSTCSGRNCISQPGTTQKLDHQGYRQRLLHRAAYRNFGTHESIVLNQSVEATAGNSGVRWWELRSPNSSPTIYQQGTYAPADGVQRWMGSIAQDRQGNMGLGYSVSDGVSTYPGIRYTGRLVSDTLGVMSQGEGVIVAGGGSQTGTAARWGDYSAMSVDPTDDCTFWYTTEYYATTSATGWKTRVGSFKFPGCTAVPTGVKTDDFNGDGKSDIVWQQSSNGYTYLGLMNGTTATSTTWIGGGTDWTPVGNADYSGDGKSDMLWQQNSTGFVYMWLMNSATMTSSAYAGGGAGWSVPRTGDFNGDGKRDILWKQPGTGYVYMALMNGTVTTSLTFIGGGSDWSVVGTGDYNGDGKTDILWQQNSTGYVFMWLMNGTTTLSTGYVGGGAGWQVAGNADFNGDGKADILWKQPGTGYVYMNLMNGTTTTASSFIGGGTDWVVAATGDYNGDGKSDILWQQSSTGFAYMWLMNGATMTSSTYAGGGAGWTVRSRP